MISIKPLILNLIKHLFVVFIIYTICRILFFAINFSSFNDITASHFLSLLFYGLRFDAFSICATNSLFILLAILPFPIQAYPFYKKILFIIFTLCNSIAIALNFIDFSYFPYTQKRTTYDVVHLVFGGQTEMSKLIPHFIADAWYIIIIYSLIIYIMIKLYKRIEKNKQILSVQLNVKKIGLTILSFLLISGFTVLGIRGGLQKIPIVMLDAALYTNQKFVPIVINTPFSLIKSAELEQLKRLNFFEETELQKYSTQIIPGDNGKSNPINVCLIILESFSKEFTKLGNRKSYTPFLDSLMSVSTVYTNAFANGKTSLNGLPSVISSMPTFMDDPYLNSSYANNKIQSLASLLKEENYQTLFFHGATNGSMNFNSYAKAAGYDTYFGRTEYNNEADYDGQWGIWDEPFMLAMCKELSKIKVPFFTTLFTLSSHNPYKVPQKYKSKFPTGPLQIQEPIGYTDYSLRQFFKEAQKTPWYKNTLFVLTADHTAISEDAFYGNSVGQHTIPLLFFKPNQQPNISHKLVQQIDIMPTILDILNYNKPYYAFGKSMLDSTSHNIVYYTGPYYHVIKDSMYYVFNDFKITETYNYITDSTLTKNINSNNQTTNYINTYFKALIQNYNNSILDNKTFYTNKK